MRIKAQKLKILFLCTGNSCRSQMAEGWARQLKSGLIDPYSAGIIAAGLSGRAVKVMAEKGVDIAGQRSKFVGEFKDTEFDFVLTLCANAHSQCPLFSGETRVLHFGFDDPPSIAVFTRTEEEALYHYRRVRDEIREFVESLPEVIYRKLEE